MCVRKLTGAFLLFYCAITFCSCIAMMKSSIKDDGEQIPPSFGREETVLLVMRKNKRGYDKYLEKNFKKYYSGKYEMIDERDLRLGKYSDQKVYRYIFSDDTRTSTIERRPMAGSRPGTGAGPAPFESTTIVKFIVTDRVTSSVYGTKHGTAAFSAWMKVYIQKLEKVRLSKMR